jgi:hypothetical protein
LINTHLRQSDEMDGLSFSANMNCFEKKLANGNNNNMA